MNTLVARTGTLLGKAWVRAFIALLLVVLLGVLFNANGSFFKWSTHRDMFRHISEYGILACGLTIVIIAAGIDLSVGSVLACVAVLFSILTIHRGWSPIASIPLCLGAGGACGAVSGWLIARHKVQPFIATLAMMVFARGLAKLISGGEKISTYVQRTDGSFESLPLPGIFRVIDSRLFGDNLAMVTFVFLACLLATWLLLEKLVVGRYFYAIGGNEDAARLSGIPVARAKLLAYGLCGLFSGIAGICHAAQEMQGDPEAGVTYELTAIAIVVIGGTSLMGGRGSVGLTLLGAVTIGYLEKILSINAVGEPARLMLTGVIIVAAVLFQKAKR